jgi:nucleotide sugar dehydrogenase
MVSVDDVSFIKDSDIIVICVPTPVDECRKPDLSCVRSASSTVASGLRKGQLVVLESTVHPGTTEEIVKPILESSGLGVEKDFFLAHCPERIDPGNRKFGVQNIPRVVGATGPAGLEKAVAFYCSIIDAEILPLSSVKAAEATKVTENTFRDINIAFVNELAQSFDRMGIDVTEVIRAASTKPFAFMAHWPGCGVGGHCIPVDPYYLISKAKEGGFSHSFLQLARDINEGMPRYTVERLKQGISEAKLDPKKVKVALLGIAYKADIADMRESPSFQILDELLKQRFQVRVFDPFVPQKSTVPSLGSAIDADCVIVATAHSAFKALSPSLLKNKGVKVIVDGRNCLDKEAIKKAGINYKGIGR